METALDVLSRAASLMQTEKKKENPDRKESTGSNTSIDSGYHEFSKQISSKYPVDNDSLHTKVESKPWGNKSLSTTKELYIKKLPAYTPVDNRVNSSVLRYDVASYQNKYQNGEKLYQRTPVISTSSTNYKKTIIHNTNSKRLLNTYTTFSDRYKPYERRDKKIIISEEFELPSVEDHFRKSLGDKYEIINTCNSIGERPSSVDEHFAKALGMKWYSLDQSKCTNS